jgi:predicted RNA-binding protein with PIN domain
MRFLIDGYNLMHAKGLLGKERRHVGLHHARRRFLDGVAAAIGPMELAETTVVFDAADPPTGRAHQTTYKGMTIVYAVGDENADARIEALIASHPAPGRLTVVSSDRRVRQAAQRRRAKSMDSDGFWARQPRTPRFRAEETAEETAVVEAGDTAYWETVFASADAEIHGSEVAGSVAEAMITQDEIDRIAREVEREDR